MKRFPLSVTILFLFCSMISWGQIENTVKLNEQMSTIVQDYNNYLDYLIARMLKLIELC